MCLCRPGSTNEIDDDQMEDETGKDKISKRSLWRYLEVAQVLRVALNTEANCRERNK